MFCSDSDIKTIAEDKLDRKEYSKYLKDVIISYKEANSITIGLSGEWGSGKTSIINMTLEYFEETQYNNIEEKPLIIKFDPWNFKDQELLFNNFFDELSKNLSDDEDILNLFKSYVDRLISPKNEIYLTIRVHFNSLINYAIVPILSFISPQFFSSIISYAQYRDNKNKDLDSIKIELNKAIEEKKRKIIIIIDNIDRLHDIEICQIFQLVKSIADFPNTIYMLSYDRNIVTNALNSIHKGNGDKYLEKIVQVPLEVPIINKKELQMLLFEEIGQIIRNTEFNNKDWGNVYYGGLRFFFNNIRHINRYINVLKYNYPLIKDGVNVVDFLAITGVQVFATEFYYEIRDNKEFFTGVTNSNKDFTTEKKIALERVNKMLDKIDESHQKPIEYLFRYLFPKFEGYYGLMNYGNDFLSIWRKNRRICSPEIFENYFRLSIPIDEISNSELETLLSLSNGNNFDLFCQELLRLNDEGKIEDVLERLEDYTQDELIIPKNNIFIIVSALMDVGDIFPIGNTGLLNLNIPMRILRVIYQLIRRFNTQNERYDILYNAIKNATRSIYTLVHEVGVQDQEHGRYDLGEPQPEENRTVSSQQLDDLEDLVTKKINLWVEKGELDKNPHLDEILEMWNNWEGKSKVRNYVANLIKSDSGLINFITGFTKEYSNWTLTDRVAQKYWDINLKSMENYVNLDEIKPRIQNIHISHEFEQLNLKNKIAVEKFLEKI